MTIKAIRLKRQEEPGRTELYEVREPRNIVVKESPSHFKNSSFTSTLLTVTLTCVCFSHDVVRIISHPGYTAL